MYRTLLVAFKLLITGCHVVKSEYFCSYTNNADVRYFQTFDQCVLTNQSECMEPKGWHPEEGYFNIIPFFCGQEELCE